MFNLNNAVIAFYVLLFLFHFYFFTLSTFQPFFKLVILFPFINWLFGWNYCSFYQDVYRLKISKYAQSYLLPHFCILLINLFVYFLINKIVSTASFQRAREEATHSCIQCIYCLGPLSIFAAPDTGNGLLTHYYGCM